MEREVIENLAENLCNRVVVTEEELKRRALRVALKVHGFEMVNLTNEQLMEIVQSFIESPITLNSLYFSEEVDGYGVKFYHLHTKSPSRRDFEIAYEEFLKSKEFLSNLERLMISADKFFFDHSKKGQFLRIYSGRNSYCVFFSTISDTFEDAKLHLELAKKFNGEYIVIVQTEKDPRDFIRFFKHYSEEFKRINAKIWVANVENLSIDPFIGYPIDFTLISRFRNPKFATLINSLWRVKIDGID
ncbi:MAG: hypothetical protein QXN34_05965 [Archaeoglobaceae archaeon]